MTHNPPLATSPDQPPTTATDSSPRLARAELGVLILAMLFPSVATWLFFVVFQQTGGAQLTYTICKIAQFALPVIWIFGVLRVRPNLRKPDARGVGSGLLFGAAVFAAMMVGYFGWFRQSVLLGDAPAALLGKVTTLGVATPLSFIAVAVFYSLVHSALEEYYWRWFVYGRLRRHVPMMAALVLGSLAFMAHHVILIGVFFQPNWPLVALFSLGVAVGGAVWAWIYERSGSLLGPWLSHLLIDAVLMTIGYDMIFRLAT